MSVEKLFLQSPKQL